MYLPSDDSLTLLDSLKYDETDKIIELGVGSGFIIDKLKCDFAVGTDLDVNSILYAKANLDDNVELVLCDSAEAFRMDSFDVAYFNPPYLPGNIDEDPKVIGGIDGSSVVKKMLNSSLSVIKENGSIFFVISSNTASDEILTKAGTIGEVHLIKRTRLFFEELYVYMIKTKKVSKKQE
ncbi:MAG: methyltransferase [Conexivisphaerales archaeon]